MYRLFLSFVSNVKLTKYDNSHVDETTKKSEEEEILMREFLKGLELDASTIDSIMAEYGKNVTKDKEEIGSLKKSLEDKDKEIATLKTTHETEKTNLTNSFNEKILNNSIETELFKAKVKDPKDVIANLDLTQIKFDDSNKLTGLDEQVKSLKESKGYLFEDDSPKGGKGGIEHGSGQPDLSMDRFRQAMGLPVNNAE